MTLQRRAMLELGGLGVCTAFFLGLVPERPVWVDLALALVAVGLVALTARETRGRFWGAPPSPRRERLCHATLHMGIGTFLVALLFAVVGASRAVQLNMVVALALFVPWAWLQQALFQFYLLGRLRTLLPGAPPSALAVLNGVLFGLVHVPDIELTMLTILGGVVWSWYYLRDRWLAPIAVSHAVLGTTYYYWIREHDLVRRWLAPLG